MLKAQEGRAAKKEWQLYQEEALIPGCLSEAGFRESYIRSVIANIDNGYMETIGDKNRLNDTDLVDTLFKDEVSIKALNDSLEGQLMPRIWGQDEISCIVCKPTNKILVGVFLFEKGGVEELYFLAKK